MKTKKKILVAVTGMSPQIVTETLYALHTQHQWLPEEIHVLTTQVGAKNITGSLLGENGFFRRLCAEYALPAIRFDADCIHVIQGETGEPLTDIRSPGENNLAADQIVRFIYDLCADEQTELHVSIAGGRKSMGFYIGYALSLFGRRQDRLSHVLVEEAFEQNREFFYPPKHSTPLNTERFGIRDAAKAQVMLADIPFVRMREGMPKLALADNWNFSRAVALTQQSLSDFSLVVDCSNMSIICSGSKPIKLDVQHFSLYKTMAEFKQEGLTCAVGDKQLLERYWKNYCGLKPGWQSHSKQIQEDISKARKEFDKELFLDEKPKMERIFHESKSRIKKKLESHLNDYARYYEIESRGGNSQKQYQLATPKENIQIVGLKKS